MVSEDHQIDETLRQRWRWILQSDKKKKGKKRHKFHGDNITGGGGGDNITWGDNITGGEITSRGDNITGVGGG